jgi:hypothetical protein
MDLKAANYRNSRADRFTRVAMLICFLLAGSVLLVTLALR